MGVSLCCIISFDYISETLIDNHTGCKLKQLIAVTEQIEKKEIMALKSFITCKRKLFEGLIICFYTFAYFVFVQNYPSFTDFLPGE